MKIERKHSAAQGGFSLIELMIAMVISMVLLAALSGIFAQSITSREKIDREGQKIETARYSLDTLAEDIRLAGYYGSLAPSLPGATLVNGATPADWKYVDPCSTTSGELPGWSTAAAQATPATNVDVPMPIFGYEAHDTGALPTALTDCLDNYKADTDVFVIRRASTTAITAGGAGYVSGDPYLQTSTCPEGAVDPLAKYPPRFLAKATTTSTDFNLHLLGCTPTVPGSNASVRKLIVRIYYISQCDDCVNNLDNDTSTVGDGVPTLKLVELGIPSTGGTVLKMKENVRTIAPGVENMHLEYGIDTSDDGSIDAWVVSNEDPRQSGSTGDAVTGMRLDGNTENRWEDVMAVKLFLVTRDLKTTTGWTDTKSFVMGSKTLAAAGDAYHRRLMSSTIKLVNMSGRRETP
jgi:type IV pilus assembly protein PilW